MVTIKEVAKRAGVSISTVSNVLNGTKFVSEPLKSRVFKAVEELNYVQDAIGSSMKRGYTKTIGIITSDICGLFYPYVLKGIYEILEPEGYTFLILDTHIGGKAREQSAYELACFRRLFSARVDGVIFVSNVRREQEAAYVKDIFEESSRFRPTPLVSVERNLSAYGIDSVYYDNIKAAEMATSHLAEYGCKRIVHISGRNSEQIPRERAETFARVLRKKGLPYKKRDSVIPGDYTHQSAYRGLGKYLERGIPFDGIYAANDQMAMGAIRLLQDRGYQIPEQVKVVGNDDVFTASLMEPGLTSVHIQKTHMGRKAAQILLEKIREQDWQQKKNQAVSLEMELRLAVRTSTDRNAGKDCFLPEW